jgi:hypothetical protein
MHSSKTGPIYLLTQASLYGNESEKRVYLLVLLLARPGPKEDRSDISCL